VADPRDRAAKLVVIPADEERLVGRESFVFTQPADRVAGKVFAQMIIIVATRSMMMFDVGGISDELRFVLGRFPREKAVEVLETVAGGPVIEGTGGGGLLGRGIVPLPPRSGAVAVVLKHLGDGGAALRDDAQVSIPVIRQLTDLTVTDTVVVATPSATLRVWANTSRCYETG
jgi:hypothetical protein